VPLWQSVSYKGARYGVPQDSEVRMYFLNNDKLRKLGKTDKEIAALPAKVDAGEFTAYDLCDLAGQAVQKGVVKYGILHRPNAGPDFQMLMESFGLVPYDKDAAKLQASKAALKDFFTWVKYCVDKKALSATNTAMSWDAIEQASFAGEQALVFFHGVWRVTDQTKAWNLKGKDDYQRKITWINAPAGKKGGKPSNLSHPIAYAVSAKSKNKELAAYIVALASQPIPNMRHSVTTNHTPINYGGQSMPEVVDKGWALVAATPMLKYASFMPNHPKIGQYNAIIFKGIQGVETGRLTAQAAADFVVDELSNELGKDVVIKN
jgi:inositol-phosphate transport system substrate-binding protein